MKAVFLVVIVLVVAGAGYLGIKNLPASTSVQNGSSPNSRLLKPENIGPHHLSSATWPGVNLGGSIWTKLSASKPSDHWAQMYQYTDPNTFLEFTLVEAEYNGDPAKAKANASAAMFSTDVGGASAASKHQETWNGMTITCEDFVRTESTIDRSRPAFEECFWADGDVAALLDNSINPGDAQREARRVSDAFSLAQSVDAATIRH